MPGPGEGTEVPSGVLFDSDRLEYRRGIVSHMNAVLVISLVAAWLITGLVSGLWMARRGFDPMWTLIALPLGPLFVPVAIERVQRRPGLAAFGQRGAPPGRTEGVDGPRVLVGLDGSAESERTLATFLRLFGSRCGLLVLAEVVHCEAAEGVMSGEIDAASHRLGALAAGVDTVGAVHTEVLAGAPGPALRAVAERHDVDLLVVGRRGRGLSARLLGSVSADLVERSSVPVLIIEPVDDAERTPKERTVAGIDHGWQ